MQNKKIIVIGSGFGGIAAALRMRAKGYEVDLHEKLDQIGGRARQFNCNGFVYDAGPTVITAPYLFRELFEIFNEATSFTLKPQFVVIKNIARLRAECLWAAM